MRNPEDSDSPAMPEDVVEAVTPAPKGRVRRKRGDGEDLVPAWLAVLVLVLLIAVVAVGGFMARGFLSGVGDTPEERAVKRWEERVEQRPTDPRLRLSLGYAYQRAELYDKALEQYRQVLQADPAETAALYNMGVIYMELGIGKQAETRLWDVLEINPRHVLAAKALGEYYAARGHYKSLIKAVRPVVQAEPEQADLQYLMGLAYERLDAPKWARARYELALKYAPGMKEAREGLKRLDGVEPLDSEESSVPGMSGP